MQHILGLQADGCSYFNVTHLRPESLDHIMSNLLVQECSITYPLSPEGLSLSDHCVVEATLHLPPPEDTDALHADGAAPLRSYRLFKTEEFQTPLIARCHAVDAASYVMKRRFSDAVLHLKLQMVCRVTETVPFLHQRETS